MLNPRIDLTVYRGAIMYGPTWLYCIQRSAETLKASLLKPPAPFASPFEVGRNSTLPAPAGCGV